MLASQQLVRDLDLGIQRLSQLQHDLNEKPSVANDAIWSDNTHMVLDQVEKQLEHALNGKPWVMLMIMQVLLMT